MKRVVTVLLCDFHLAEGEEVEGVTRQVRIDGLEREPELCDSCYGKYAEPFRERLRRLPKPKRKSRRRD